MGGGGWGLVVWDWGLGLGWRELGVDVVAIERVAVPGRFRVELSKFPLSLNSTEVPRLLRDVPHWTLASVGSAL